MRVLSDNAVPQRYDPASLIRLLREIAGELNRVSAYAGTATWNPASIADGDSATTSVTVPGVVLGALASVRVFTSISMAGLQVSGYVSADDTVTLVLNNNTGAAVNLDSSTFGVIVENMVKTA